MTSPAAAPFDPVAAAESARRLAAKAAAALAHMDAAVTRAEAGLAIARHHHVRRLAQLEMARR